ncbi:MAG: sulfurtransferase [Pararhodobacter sp.]|nr:sulfurtransferase [Pararhodobacter sp.]
MSRLSPRKTALTLTLSTALATAGAALPALAAPEGWQPLLEPAALAALLDAHGEDIRIVHVTGDFGAGHIPGAGHAPYPQWRSGPENPGALRSPEHFADLARDLGLTHDTPTVVVHGGANPTDMGAAARVYWTLRSLGVEDLALLNGGFAAWAEAGLPVATEPVEIAPSETAFEWRDDWRVSTDEVVSLVEAGDARLIDARPNDFFTGLQWTIAAPGTIRNSSSLTFEQFFEGNRMQGAEVIREIAAREGFTDAPLTVSFCNTGHWAAINWFALSELAQVPQTRLYPESMAEYAALGHPLDNAPNRLVYYWRVTANWVSDLF